MSALQELSLSIQDLFRVSCVFNCPHPVEVNDPAAATHLYRIAQEACHNAMKHGQAGHIIVELLRTNDHVILSVRDDGAGFSQLPSASKGMGLQIMRYRAAMVGGSIAIRPNEPSGCIITCESGALR
jgi:signal transduction histidine kinase